MPPQPPPGFKLVDAETPPPPPPGFSLVQEGTPDAPPPPPPGFQLVETPKPSGRKTTGKLTNAASDVGELVSGISSLIAQGMYTPVRDVKSFAQTLGGTPYSETESGKFYPGVVNAVKGMPRQIVNDIKEYRHPADRFHNHPVYTTMDAMMALSLIGGVAKPALRVAATSAEAAGKEATAAGIRKFLTAQGPDIAAGTKMIPVNYSQNPVVHAMQSIIEGTSEKIPAVRDILSAPVLRDMVPPTAISAEARQAMEAGKEIRRAKTDFFVAKNREQDLIRNIFESVPEDERKGFVAYVQGRATPTKMSKQFQEAVETYKSKVLTEQQKFHITDETAKRVAYQPLVVASKAKYDLPIAADIDYISEANRGNMSAIRKVYQQAIHGEEKAQATVRQWNTEIEGMRLKEAEAGVQAFLGKSAGANNVAKDIARELTPTPVYFPSVFKDKIRISDFMPSTRLQRFKAGFQKGRTGASGFEELDPVMALEKHSADVQKWQMQEHLVQSIQQQFAEPLPTKSALKPGYRVFAPDGYLKFYRANLNMQDAFIRGVETGVGADEAYINAIKSIVESEAPESRAIIGVRKAPLYQIPEAVAKKLDAELTPLRIFDPETQSAAKLLWDKPLDAFRFNVLGLHPGWIVNNFGGNIATSLMSRVNLPKAFMRLTDKTWAEAIKPAVEELEAGGFRRSEARFMGQSRLQPGASAVEKAADTIGKILTSPLGLIEDSAAAEAARVALTFPIRAVKGFATTMYEVNSKVEDAFRRAVFVDRAAKEASKMSVEETIGKLAQSNLEAKPLVKRVEELVNNPSTREKLVDQVNDILNDYSRLSKFERGVVRRVFPFWSWWKFMNTFAVRLVARDPAMAQTVRALATVGNDIEASEWKKNGLDVKELPLYRRGSAPTGPAPEDKNTIRAVSGRAMNPLGTVGIEGLGFAPPINLFLERRSGRNAFTGATFQHPAVVETSPGRFEVYNPTTKKMEPLPGPVAPPFLSHVARSYIPSIRDIEQAVYPYRTYDTSPIGNPIPKLRRGKPIPVDNSLRVGSILGYPTVEVDKKMQKVSAVKSKQAVPQVRRTLRRIDKARKKIGK